MGARPTHALSPNPTQSTTRQMDTASPPPMATQQRPCGSTIASLDDSRSASAQQQTTPPPLRSPSGSSTHKRSSSGNLLSRITFLRNVSQHALNQSTDEAGGNSSAIDETEHPSPEKEHGDDNSGTAAAAAADPKGRKRKGSLRKAILLGTGGSKPKTKSESSRQRSSSLLSSRSVSSSAAAGSSGSKLRVDIASPAHSEPPRSPLSFLSNASRGHRFSFDHESPPSIHEDGDGMADLSSSSALSDSEYRDPVERHDMQSPPKAWANAWPTSQGEAVPVTTALAPPSPPKSPPSPEIRRSFTSTSTTETQGTKTTTVTTSSDEDDKNSISRTTTSNTESSWTQPPSAPESTTTYHSHHQPRALITPTASVTSSTGSYFPPVQTLHAHLKPPLIIPSPPHQRPTHHTKRRHTPSPLSNPPSLDPLPLHRTSSIPLSPTSDTSDSALSATQTYGYILLLGTWLIFVIGLGSCFNIWTWAWDVDEKPFAPPELEDDPTLPITGYYPALLVLSGAVMSWVWVVVAWVGMKYFRHARGSWEED